MGLRLDPHYRFTRAQVLQYAKDHGIIPAIEWLSLIPPDKFDGDWQAMYDELESNYYWGIEGDISNAVQ